MSESDHVVEAQAKPAPRQRGCLLAAGIVAGILLLLACALVGMVWAGGQQAKKELAAQYPPLGQMVDVGGYRLHIHCQGPKPAEGGPTVVIEAGMGDFSLSWDQVQKEVAEFTRVCTYDRAGPGWSERSPNPRTAPYAVDELHRLLTNSGLEPPHVLVGHSLGGYYVRLYAHEHPDQVAGMVLVDTGHEDENLRLPEAYQQAKERFDRQSVSALRVPQVLSAIGILARSPDDYPSGVLPPLPPGAEDTYKALLAIDSSFFDTAIEEYETFGESTAHMRAAQLGTLGDIPLIVVTAGQPEIRETLGVSAKIAAETLAVRREIQAELAALSPNGKQVIAEESGHLVQIDQPELVVDAIREVVGAAQR